MKGNGDSNGGGRPARREGQKSGGHQDRNIMNSGPLVMGMPFLINSLSFSLSLKTYNPTTHGSAVPAYMQRVCARTLCVCVCVCDGSTCIDLLKHTGSELNLAPICRPSRRILRCQYPHRESTHVHAVSERGNHGQAQRKGDTTGTAHAALVARRRCRRAVGGAEHTARRRRAVC